MENLGNYLTNKDLEGLSVNGWVCDPHCQGSVMFSCKSWLANKQTKEVMIWATPHHDEIGKVPLEITDSWGESVFLGEFILDDRLSKADQRTMYVNLIKMAINLIPKYKHILGVNKDRR